MLGNRDTGLIRAVSARSLAASIVNAVIGGGIFAAPAAIAAAVGAWGPLAFVFCAFIIGAVAICFAEGGSRIPTSGGPYGYIEFALGPFAGFVAGNLLWAGNLLASGGVAAALADTIAGRSPILRTAVIVAVVGFIALINYRGVTQSAQLIDVATVIKLALLAVFIAAGATAIHADNLTQSPAAAYAGFGRAMILALYTLTGMETVLSISGEVAEPARSIPRALAIATISTALLFTAIQFIAQGVLGSALATSAAPLADAMARVHPGLRIVILIGTAAALFGFLASDLMGTPRMVFAFAREGSMPAVLGRVHPRNHTPHTAIVFYSALAMILAATGTFAELAVMSTLFAVVYYALGCIAAWLLVRRKVALAGEPLNFRWLTPSAIVALAGMILMIALAAREEILGLLGFIAIAVSIYAILRKLRHAD